MRRIVVTPAGRKRYLEVLLLHMIREYNQAGFQEWHLWLNTNVQEDIRYCRQLADQYEWIKVVDVMVTNQAVSNYNICKFFKFACDKDSVYVRLDDDIVFVEQGFFDKIFTFRLDNPQYFLVYANIINNACISFLHQKRGLFLYPNEGGFNCMHHQGWGNPFYAETLHRTFIADVHCRRINKWHNTFDVHVCSGFERVSINCISWLGSTFAEFNGEVGSDEEQWLACEKPRSINTPNAIYGGAIVVHFAFFTQRHHIDTTNILQIYKEIAESMSPQEAAM